MEHRISLDNFLYSDEGLIILSLLDIETLKTFFLKFSIYYVLNCKRVLEHLREVHRIIPKIKSFQEYYCQYIIKYGKGNSLFNIKVTLDNIILNDNVEALTSLEEIEKSKIYIFREVTVNNSKKIIDYLSKLKYFSIII